MKTFSILLVFILMLKGKLTHIQYICSVQTVYPLAHLPVLPKVKHFELSSRDLLECLVVRNFGYGHLAKIYQLLYDERVNFLRCLKYDLFCKIHMHPRLK